MKASVVDLRYRMKDVLSALDRQEEVTVMHRGKVKGTIVPQRGTPPMRAAAHPLFGVLSGSDPSVDAVMNQLREGRHHGV